MVCVLEPWAQESIRFWVGFGVRFRAINRHSSNTMPSYLRVKADRTKRVTAYVFILNGDAGVLEWKYVQNFCGRGK
jgi:hypothetical protein